MLNLVMTAMQQVWTPHATELYEKNPETVPSVYGQFLTYILLAFGLLSVSMTVVGPEIIYLLASSEYYGAAAAVGPLALGFLFYASAQVTYLGVTLLKKKLPLAALPWIAALVNIGANILFIPRIRVCGCRLVNRLGLCRSDHVVRAGIPSLLHDWLRNAADHCRRWLDHYLRGRGTPLANARFTAGSTAQSPRALLWGASHCLGRGKTRESSMSLRRHKRNKFRLLSFRSAR